MNRSAIRVCTLAILALLISLPLPRDAEARRYASIVVDFESGTILHAENPDRQVYPASLTKMMTLYLLFEALDEGRLTLDSSLPVSRRAQGQPPSKLGLRAGQTIKVEDAIHALAIKSANDVATVVAEALGGTEWEFAQIMTAKARSLGMNKTTFRNASGLPDNKQVTTARDMARLSEALLRNHRARYHYFSAKQFSYNGRAYSSHNNLLGRYEGTDGIKTGYIRASGFNLAASVERRGRRLVAVVFGGRTARTRDAHMIDLLNRTFPRAYALTPLEPIAPATRNPFRAAPTALASAETELPPAPVIVPDAAAIQQGSAAGGSLDEALNSLSFIGQAQAAAPEVPRGEWSVQVGAFKDYAPAEAMARKAADQVAELVPPDRVAIPQLPGNNGPLYRARLVDLPETRAREACAKLEANRIDCLVIRNGG